MPGARGIWMRRRGVEERMTDTLELKHGLQYNLDQGSIGVVHLSNPVLDGQPAHVLLSVATLHDQEQDHSLAVGDRFMVGEETWLVASIDGVGGDDYTVRIVRVDGSAPPPGVELSPERVSSCGRSGRSRRADGSRHRSGFGGRSSGGRASCPATVRHTGHRDRGA